MPLPRKKKQPAAVQAAPVDLDAQRELLLDLRRRLVGDHRALRRDSLDNTRAARAPLHPADAATDSQDQEFNALLRAGNADMLDDVNEALERIQAGTYGTCLHCGLRIGAGRLRAKPWARLCIDCKGREEAGLPPRNESAP